ncbi:Na+/H+ antiporter NhaA [Rhizobium sp. BK251]|uniref:Na+/H+ antiporter NhaA n=1 Tax=Rhizobium sp. BK251 TaxID=2512125 RepID=UPI002479541F|nr:Na+/H+ antiporter NhaA [Rhizobium sp. BK251]
MYRVWRRLGKYSLLLIVGALSALIWANVSPTTYHALIDYSFWQSAPIGAVDVSSAEPPSHQLSLHFLINDVLMALAGKEVWEAVALKGGALRGKKALTPLIATAGGMLGPAFVYLSGAAVIGKMALLARGWAIPTATDIAFPIWSVA